MKRYGKAIKNNEFKISAPMWNEKFELRGRWYFVSDIQYYFEYMLKEYGEKNENPPIIIYVNQIKNINTFKIKTGKVLNF